jgi:hypothetical protein
MNKRSNDATFCTCQNIRLGHTSTWYCKRWVIAIDGHYAPSIHSYPLLRRAIRYYCCIRQRWVLRIIHLHNLTSLQCLLSVKVLNRQALIIYPRFLKMMFVNSNNKGPSWAPSPTKTYARSPMSYILIDLSDRIGWLHSKEPYLQSQMWLVV